MSTTTRNKKVTNNHTYMNTGLLVWEENNSCLWLMSGEHNSLPDGRLFLSRVLRKENFP